DTAEVGAVEVGTDEVGPAEIGIAEVGTAEVATVEVGTAELHTIEVGNLLTRISPSIPFLDSLLPALEQFDSLIAIHGSDPHKVVARSIPSVRPPFVALSQYWDHNRALRLGQNATPGWIMPTGQSRGTPGRSGFVVALSLLAALQAAPAVWAWGRL